MESELLLAKFEQGILPLDDLTALVNEKASLLEKLDVLYLHVEGKAREMIVGI
jgi:hypothetical protein